MSTPMNGEAYIKVMANKLTEEQSRTIRLALEKQEFDQEIAAHILDYIYERVG